MKNSFLPSANKRGIRHQGCQMVYFQSKNPNLGIFWSALVWKMMVFLLPFGMFYGNLENFVAILYM
jgi:hypothetical protein